MPTTLSNLLEKKATASLPISPEEPVINATVMFF
jgi:hypothetical protein